MKNIHVLPTPNPSRLISDNVELSLLSEIYTDYSNWGVNRHVYITSDEEIKDGDYCLDGDDIYGPFQEEDIATVKFLKIILTTDEQLIRYGVQAIDNEFLEWFVKNPCEEIEVKPLLSNNGRALFSYKITIPKEEPKQDEIMERFIANAKQETIEFKVHKKHCYIGENENSCKYNDNDCPMKPIPFKNSMPMIDVNQETHEITSIMYYPAYPDGVVTSEIYALREGFMKGFKVAQERSYSEEEIIDLLYKRDLYLLNRDENICLELPKEWFEQFKKK
jgi:hypothetical protein